MFIGLEFLNFMSSGLKIAIAKNFLPTILWNWDDTKLSLGIVRDFF